MFFMFYLSFQKIDHFDKCMESIKALDLKEIIKNNLTDFYGMHNEVEKREFIYLTY